MKKKISIILATALALSSFAMTFASADDGNLAKLSDTRYRFPLVNMEKAIDSKGEDLLPLGKQIPFLKGSPISSDSNAKKAGLDKISYTTAEKYKVLGMDTRAIKVLAPGTMSKDPSLKDGDYQGFRFCPSKKAGTTNAPFANRTGIKANSTDAGIMYYIETKGIGDEPAYMIHNRLDDATEDYFTNKYPEFLINTTFHEYDFNADGTAKSGYSEELEKDVAIATAYNLGDDNKITCVWTKTLDVSFPGDKPVIDPATNKPMVDANGKGVMEPITINKKKGDVEYAVSSTGAITLPRGFTGYVIIPFSSMQIAEDWVAGNPNGIDDCDDVIDLKKIIQVSLHTGFYSHYAGEMYIADLSFYGTAFADVPGTLDFKDFLTINSDTSDPSDPIKPPTVSGDMADDNSQTSLPPASRPIDEDEEEYTESGEDNVNAGSNGISGVVGVLALAGLAIAGVIIKKRK